MLAYQNPLSSPPPPSHSPPPSAAFPPPGKSREEVKATLKSERAKIPRRRLTNRRRTSRYLGVGSSNRKNQWQVRDCKAGEGGQEKCVCVWGGVRP